jgi:eukaryotic-like serine/threonine-protein kinase
VNPRLADTRSDLYSLGATYYFLLTGKVPFPGGTPLEKVIHHQVDEPAPIEKLRPGIPSEVQGIVRKLLAKKPADRYQTPNELVETLSVLLRQMELASELKRARGK